MQKTVHFIWSVCRIEAKSEMSVAEVEGKFKLQEDTKAMSNMSIIFNLIFSIIIMCFIIETINVNILSSTGHGTGYGGVAYLDCGWDSFNAHWYDASENKTWSNQYQQCISNPEYYPDVSCDWYNNPLKSGQLWYYCNIITFVSLVISTIGYIIIFVTNKYPKLKEKYPSIIQKRLFVTILFQSFIPTISLLIAIVSWFHTNTNHPGCWQPTYLFESITYTDRQIGESMIFDIVAVILVGIHLLVYVNYSCVYLGFGNKKKRNRKIKHGEPMLFEHNYNDDIVAIGSEYEGYNDQHMEHDVENENHVRIESIVGIAPGNDQMDDESDMKMDDVEQ
eukprot:134693_1